MTTNRIELTPEQRERARKVLAEALAPNISWEVAQEFGFYGELVDDFLDAINTEPTLLEQVAIAIAAELACGDPRDDTERAAQAAIDALRYDALDRLDGLVSVGERRAIIDAILGES